MPELKIKYVISVNSKVIVPKLIEDVIDKNVSNGAWVDKRIYNKSKLRGNGPRVDRCITKIRIRVFELRIECKQE